MIDDKKSPYIIAEIANAAQGNYQANFELIQNAKDSGAPAVKFQFYKYDVLTTPAYSKYEIYEQTFYTAEQRSEFVKFAKELELDVWVDVFDSWGLDVVKDNIEYVDGIKIPPTVSLNHKLVSNILSLEEDIPILLGVGGLNDYQVDRAVRQVNDSNKKIILMYGYQGFPTNEKDTALSRIGYLKQKYGYDIGFADHVDAESDLSIKMPCYAYFAGASIIEKHITLDRAAKGYDYYSSLELDEYKEMVKELERCSNIAGIPDNITQDQEKYMSHAVRAVVSCDKNEGDLIFENDVDFKRTGNQADLLPNEIRPLLPVKATKDLKINCGIDISAVTKARTGIVVLCRLNSTRLSKKALLKLSGKTAVQRCLNNCLESEMADEVVLATSTDPNDSPLETQLVDGVKYFKGDPDNPARRILQVAEQYDLDFVVRVTGDSPLISYELIDQLISSHLTSGAEYSYIGNAPLGTRSEIFNTNAIKKLFNRLETEKYSEYLTLYFKNNPSFFKINKLELSDENILKYKDARFTLDYEEDYNFLSSIFNKLGSKEYTKLSELFDVLDENSQLLNINSHIIPKYVKNRELAEELDRVTKINR